MDEQTKGTRSSIGENTSNKVIHLSRSLQATKCSGTYKDIFYISEGSNIEVMGNTQTVTDDREGDELEDTMVVPS